MLYGSWQWKSTKSLYFEKRDCSIKLWHPCQYVRGLDFLWEILCLQFSVQGYNDDDDDIYIMIKCVSVCLCVCAWSLPQIALPQPAMSARSPPQPLMSKIITYSKELVVTPVKHPNSSLSQESPLGPPVRHQKTSHPQEGQFGHQKFHDPAQ